jgi:hypothetical protein
MPLASWQCRTMSGIGLMKSKWALRFRINPALDVTAVLLKEVCAYHAWPL